MIHSIKVDKKSEYSVLVFVNDNIENEIDNIPKDL